MFKNYIQNRLFCKNSCKRNISHQKFPSQQKVFSKVTVSYKFNLVKTNLFYNNTYVYEKATLLLNLFKIEVLTFLFHTKIEVYFLEV